MQADEVEVPNFSELQDLEAMWALWDEDGSGELDKDEFSMALKMLQVREGRTASGATDACCFSPGLVHFSALRRWRMWRILTASTATSTTMATVPSRWTSLQRGGLMIRAQAQLPRRYDHLPSAIRDWEIFTP